MAALVCPVRLLRAIMGKICAEDGKNFTKFHTAQILQYVSVLCFKVSICLSVCVLVGVYRS